MTVYERAWSYLEAADRAHARSIRVMSTPLPRRIDANEWTCAHVAAKRAADAAVDASDVLPRYQRLVDRARNDREYAKAVAARIQMAAAIWDSAYGRAMPKKFRIGS